MSILLTLCKRQLTSYFYRPLAYMVMVIFLIIAGLDFCWSVSQCLKEPMQVGELLFGATSFWAALLALITLITMHLFTEEKQTRTIEMVLTAPVTDTELVLAKYYAALFFFGACFLPTFIYLSVLKFFSTSINPFDLRPVLTGYFGLFLIGAFYIAFGLLASATARSQVAAAAICFAGICMIHFSDVFLHVVRGTKLEPMLTYVSSQQHIMNFTHGIIDSRSLVFYLLGILFLLFMTVKVVESRRWK